MKNKEILKKVIEKASDLGGYYNEYIDSYIEEGYWSEIIFSHDFAKAFWGLETEEIFDGFGSHDAGDGYMEDYNKYKEVISWQYHLQEMVLEEEPLKYLESFL